MKKRPIRYTLAGKFTLLAAGLITVSLAVISVVSIYRYNRMADQKVEQLTENIVALINRSIDYIIADVVDTSRLLLTSQAVQDTLIHARETKGSYEFTTHQNEMLRLLNNMVYNKQYISMLYVGNESVESKHCKPAYFTASMLPVDFNNPPQWIQETRARNGMGYWLKGEKLVDFKGNLLVFSRQIKNLQLLNEIGIMAIGIDGGTLDDIFSQLEKSNPVTVVIQEENEPIYSYQGGSKDFFEGLSELETIEFLQTDGFATSPTGEYCFVKSSYNREADWRITCVVRYDDFKREKRTTVLIVTGLALAMTFIMVAASYSITRRSITGTLSQLRAFAEGFRDGVVPVAVDDNRDDEVAVISKEFQRVVQENEELMGNLYKSLYKEKEAELTALQAQINPHFLYNTLDSIFWVAQEYGADDIGRMAVALSKVFRMSLNRGQPICELRNELELIDNYLTIQNMRYSNKFRVNIYVPDELMGKKVIKLMLQPIIENAIIHGLEPKKDEGHIDVVAWEELDGLIVVVKDDGVGFEVDPQSPLGKGYALKNVDDRIRLYYGDEYGVTIDSHIGAGTTVTIRIGHELRRSIGGLVDVQGLSGR